MYDKLPSSTGTVGLRLQILHKEILQYIKVSVCEFGDLVIMNSITGPVSVYFGLTGNRSSMNVPVLNKTAWEPYRLKEGFSLKSLKVIWMDIHLMTDRCYNGRKIVITATKITSIFSI